MRIAAEQKYELSPSDSTDFVKEHLGKKLDALRAVDADKTQSVTIIIEIEAK